MFSELYFLGNEKVEVLVNMQKSLDCIADGSILSRPTPFEVTRSHQEV